MNDSPIADAHEFFERTAPLLEKQLVYPELLSAEERLKLKAANGDLQAAEATVRARGAGALGSGAAVLQADGCAVLRRYLGRGFEALRTALGFEPEPGPVLVAAYGTLMTGQRNRLPAATRAALQSRGSCAIDGRLYLVRDGAFAYPGLIRPDRESAGREPAVSGELFEIAPDDAAAVPVLRSLDRYEDVRPSDPEGSAYRRRFVRVSVSHGSGAAYAWLYVYNEKLGRLGPIPGGNWPAFLREMH